MNEQQKDNVTILPSPVDLVFPNIDVTAGEMMNIALHLTDPAVRKYLISLGRNMGKELATLPVGDLTDKQLADAHRTILGRIDVINTLLSIENPNPTT